MFTIPWIVNRDLLFSDACRRDNELIARRQGRKVPRVFASRRLWPAGRHPISLWLNLQVAPAAQKNRSQLSDPQPNSIALLRQRSK